MNRRDGHVIDRLVLGMATSGSRRAVVRAAVASSLSALAAVLPKKAIAQGDCPEGQANCNGRCIVLSGVENCGACGNGCAYGGGETPGTETCVNGTCVCLNAWLTRCGFDNCVDVANDPYNCGGCGFQCASGSCSNGACLTRCEPGATDCGGYCAYLGSDPYNCGACGVGCASGVCDAGVCATPNPEPNPDAFADDLDVLAHLLAAQKLTLAFYRQGLDAFPLADVSPEMKDSRLMVSEIRKHKKEQVDLLASSLVDRGGVQPKEPRYGFKSYEDFGDLLLGARDLEATIVGVYVNVIPAVADPAVASLIASIATVQARYAAYLNLATGTTPFPDLMDAPVSRQQSIERFDRFIAG